jgi:hypothetical protein
METDLLGELGVDGGCIGMCCTEIITEAFNWLSVMALVRVFCDDSGELSDSVTEFVAQMNISA